VKNKYYKSLILALIAILSPTTLVRAQSASQSGSVGVSGIVNAPAPTNAPIISQPANGASFTKVPITVNGICDSDLLVKIFKNGVFAGSAQCSSGSFSLLLDLFNGRNDITAKQYDLLDQESPTSAIVSVTYNDNIQNSTSTDRVVLTTNFAKKGADPDQKLIWPFALSGGTGPYAVTVEWGDGDNDLYSIVTPGEFSIDHKYKNPGSYTVVVKAVDVNGKTALIQVVAISNGALAQDNINGQTSTGGTVTGKKTSSGSGSGGGSGNSDVNGQPKTRILWQPAAIMIPFVISTFWLGKRYAIHRLRKKIEAGERPFSY
jgi:hypothetical protein